MNVLQILDIAIDLAKSLKETELTVVKPLEIGGQGTKLLWGPYDSRQGGGSVGPEAERGEIDPKIGRRVGFV